MGGFEQSRDAGCIVVSPRRLKHGVVVSGQNHDLCVWIDIRMGRHNIDPFGKGLFGDQPAIAFQLLLKVASGAIAIHLVKSGKG